MNENVIFTTLSTMPATGDNFPFLTVGIVAAVAVAAIIILTILSKKKK